MDGAVRHPLGATRAYGQIAQQVADKTKTQRSLRRSGAIRSALWCHAIASSAPTAHSPAMQAASTEALATRPRGEGVGRGAVVSRAATTAHFCPKGGVVAQ